MKTGLKKKRKRKTMNEIIINEVLKSLAPKIGSFV